MKCFTKVALIVSLLTSAGPAWSILLPESLDETHYKAGKSFFVQGKDGLAREKLFWIPLRSDYYLRARYIIGASFARQKYFDKAKVLFFEVLKFPVRSISDRQVKDLARLGLARLFFFENDLRSAVQAYRLVSLDSLYRRTMLYELTTAYIRYGDMLVFEPQVSQAVYKSAEDTLASLLQLSDVIQDDPRVKLLQADLRMRQNKTAVALATYRGLSEYFTKVKAKLRLLRGQEHRALESIFQSNFTLHTGTSWLDSQTQSKLVSKKMNRLKVIKERVDFLLEEARRIREMLPNSSWKKDIDGLIGGLMKNKKELESLTFKSRSLFGEYLGLAMNRWEKSAGWILAGAENGLLRGELRENFVNEQKIQAIDRVKQREINRVNLEIATSEMEVNRAK